jgi:hypothetical protein
VGKTMAKEIECKEAGLTVLSNSVLRAKKDLSREDILGMAEVAK